MRLAFLWERKWTVVFHDICFLSCGGCSKALFLPYFPTLGASSSLFFLGVSEHMEFIWKEVIFFIDNMLVIYEVQDVFKEHPWKPNGWNHLEPKDSVVWVDGTFLFRLGSFSASSPEIFPGISYLRLFFQGVVASHGNLRVPSPMPPHHPPKK